MRGVVGSNPTQVLCLWILLSTMLSMTDLVQVPSRTSPSVIMTDINPRQRTQHGSNLHVADVRASASKFPLVQPDLPASLLALLPTVHDDVDVGVCRRASFVAGGYADLVGYSCIWKQKQSDFIHVLQTLSSQEINSIVI